MNRIKQTCALLPAIVLALGVALQPGIGGVLADDTKQTEENIELITQTGAEATEPETESVPEATVEAMKETAAESEEYAGETPTADEYIYFDLAAGNVSIGDVVDGKKTYSGYVYVNGAAAQVSGDHEADNKYYVYQSNPSANESGKAHPKNTGYVSENDYQAKQNCRVPEYSRVSYGGKLWKDYITNNTKVKDEVITNWGNAAAAVGRTGTPNHINFNAGAAYDVTIDNIWSTKHDQGTGRHSGGIQADLGNNENTDIRLRLKGDSRVGNIHYFSNATTNSLQFFNGDDSSTPGSITVATYNRNGNCNGNYWNAAIGGSDSYEHSKGIVINSGVIYAGTTREDNCTAIGGGGNGYGIVTIHGGTVTAVAATTGTAIGGGIGWNSQGGNANVTIDGGTIYAYNLGVGEDSPNAYSRYVPAAAIGGGSSENADGNGSTTVTISGGTVYAQSMSGAAIGGGGSSNKNGGGAAITIDGGTIIAKSVGGSVTYKKKEGPGTEFNYKFEITTEEISAGVSIGGGTGHLSGGSVTLDISGSNTNLRTGSIGGGNCTGSGKIGSANVKISGGDIIGQVIMAGGAAKNCTFDMSDGTLHGTDVINGVTVGEDITKNFGALPETIDISYIQQNGGAVWMEDTNGVTTIIGGTIEGCTANQGGAVYMKGGTANISGGTIEGCTAKLGGAVYMEDGAFTLSGNGKINGNTAQYSVTGTGYGGGVYVTGGDVTVSGGSIGEDDAPNNAVDGAGVYVNGGTVEVKEEGHVQHNTATQNGGGIYVTGGNVTVSGGFINDNHANESGGGVYLPGGDFTMTDGAINSNDADIRGGGIFLTKKPTLTKGIISGNTAGDSGGGICVNGDEVELTSAVMQIFGNEAKNGGGVAVLNGDFILSGGAVGVENGISDENSKANIATENGGGVYVANDTNDTVPGTSTGSSTASVIVKSGNIWYNKANYGGGVYLESGDFTMLEETEVTASIRHNTATVDGGGVYLKNGEFIMDDKTAFISHNSSARNGGGIYLYTNPILLQGTIAENTATENGGGMCIEDCLVTLEPTGTMTINGNGAKSGAGIFIHGAPKNPAPTSIPDPITQIDVVSSASVRPPDAVGLLVSEDTTGKLILTNNIATENGGAVCVDAADADSRFQLDTEHVTVTGNSAENGGGVAVLNGNFTMTAGSIGEKDGANTATANGGGVYVAGNFHMLGGTIGGNTAANGGGVYVNDGDVTVIYGDISNNTATEDGGGFHVSSETSSHIQVVMLSGSLSRNQAGANGGGMAVESTKGEGINVEIGCLLNHDLEGGNGKPNYSIDYTTGDANKSYNDYAVFDGKTYTHDSCPKVEYNQADEIGGGFYMNSAASTLAFYCVEEAHNTAQSGNTAGMDVEGGKVIIGDEHYHNHIHDETLTNKHVVPWGYVSMDDATLVNGGQVDIYGDMTNPIFKEEVTVDIEDEDDHFLDHRRAKENEKHYKVHYFENFDDKGLYKERQYNDGETNITIESALFSHPGYTIVGWCTLPDNDPTAENYCYYEVGKEVDLTKLGKEDGMGIHTINCEICGTSKEDSNLLVLYGIWEANGYTVVFNPNVPAGDTYIGIMENQVLNYDEPKELSKNKYQYPGHIFTGWNTQADGKGTAYTDEQKVSNLTDKNGVEVVLYAQWSVCEHKDPHRWKYEVSEDKKTLLRICDCGGQTLTATLNAENTVFDGYKHPATLIYNDEQAWGEDKPTIETIKYSGEWINDVHTGVDQLLTDQNPIPLHAGVYTASITKPDANSHGNTQNPVTASIEYTIAKANQPAPDKPTYTPPGKDGKTVTIERLGGGNDPTTLADKAGEIQTARAQYRLNHSGSSDIAWEYMGDKDELTITMDNAYTTYIVEARYEELNDYNASEITRANSTYFFVGNVRVEVECDEGIHYGEMTFSQDENGLNNGIAFPLTLKKDGYYLIDGKYMVTAQRWTINNEGATLGDPQDMSQNMSVSGSDNALLAIRNIRNDSYLLIRIGKTRKNPTVDAKVAPKQVFSSVTNTETTISRDSAYTAAFQINNFDPQRSVGSENYGPYTDLNLRFDSDIPADTTVIFLDCSNGGKTYWYYRVENENGTGTVSLTQFKKMGGNETDRYVIPVPEDHGYIDLRYQFIVDFSQSTGFSMKDSLNMTLQATVRDDHTENVPAINKTVNVAMKDSGFILTRADNPDNPEGVDDLTNSLTCTFNEGAAASKWNNRASALVLTPKKGTVLPPDAQIKAEVGGGTTYLYQTNGSFIVPLSLLTAEAKTAKLTLKSALFPAKGDSYFFTVQWLISPSKAGKAPRIGDQAGSIENVTFIFAEQLPSLKSEGQQRILTAQDTLELDIKKENMDGYTVSAALLRKADGGTYTETGWNQMNVSTDRLSVSLGGQTPGSYCMMFTVKKNGDDSITIVMEVPYYFVVREPQ